MDNFVLGEWTRQRLLFPSTAGAGPLPDLRWVTLSGSA